MRISGISSYNYNNYNNKNNAAKNNKQVSFGRFADERTDKAFVEAANKLPDEVKRYKALGIAGMIRDCCFNKVYTDDKSDGKIRVEWDEKMINAKGRNLDHQMVWIDDLREYPSMLLLRLRMDRITEAMLGLEPRARAYNGNSETEADIEKRQLERLLDILSF